jgi:hypothetical protein
MFNNNARRQSERSLRLHWFLTGDQSWPLGSAWSIDLPQGPQTIQMAAVQERCNVAVIEKCETPVSRQGRVARSLTICAR